MPTILPIIIKDTDNTQACKVLIQNTHDVSKLSVEKLQHLGTCIHTLYPKAFAFNSLGLRVCAAILMLTFLVSYFLTYFQCDKVDDRVVDSKVLNSFLIAAGITFIIGLALLILIAIVYTVEFILGMV